VAPHHVGGLLSLCCAIAFVFAVLTWRRKLAVRAAMLAVSALMIAVALSDSVHPWPISLAAIVGGGTVFLLFAPPQARR
jgi:hypothetical protein